jgi:predicted TIM-barrel fold metal-dependent hydrolase
MSRLKKLIDVHSHAIFDFRAEPTSEKWLSTPHDLPAWSMDGALEQMDKHEIDTAVISSPNAANDLVGQVGRDMSRRVNEAIAEMMVKHPTRFGGMATLPGRDIDGCLKEMEYALDVLKLDGVATSTSINDVHLGEDVYDPWFEEMNSRGVTLFIHPTILSSFPDTSLGLYPSVFEFMFDTTRMLANMVITGKKKRFSKMNMITTHAGGTMPFLVERFQTRVSTYGTGKGREKVPAEEVRQVLASFYYDLTSSTTNTQLLGLIELVPISQLLMGLDMPFSPDHSIGKAIERVGNYPGFTETDLDMIAHGNAARLYPQLAKKLGIEPSPSLQELNDPVVATPKWGDGEKSARTAHR